MRTDALYNRLPAHIRSRDLREGAPLKALMAILQDEYEVLEDDIGRLYDNWFIETCQAWAVPYIGDLLGVSPLADDPRGTAPARAYVANTLDYRRAKGTAAVLEQLARDVTGWPSRVVELFLDLTQSQHLNHVRPDNPHSVDLRDADLASRGGTAFDPWSHSVDIRPISTGAVRHNIPNIAIFLARLQSYRLGFALGGAGAYQGGVEPREAAPGRFHLDPLGRDIPLFNRGRADSAVALRSREADMPLALRRYPLFTELQARRAGTVPQTAYFGERPVLSLRLNGSAVPPERLHACDLTEVAGDWPRPRMPGHVRFDPLTGRVSLHPDDAPGARLEAAYSYGAADDLGGGPYDRRDSIESWRDAVLIGADNAPADLWQVGVTRQSEAQTMDPGLGGPVVGSLNEALALWNTEINEPGARGLITILDSGTYDLAAGADPGPVALAENATLAICAAGWPRQTGRRVRQPGALVPQDVRPHVIGDLRVLAATGEGGQLILDGILLEGDLEIGAGDLRDLWLHNCTIGATAAGLTGAIRIALSNAALAIRGSRAVLPEIAAPGAGGSISLSDGVIGEDRAADGGRSVLTPGIIAAIPGFDLALARMTICGGITARTLTATDCLFTGSIEIARRQEGCVRYSFLPDGARTPRRFRCQPDLALETAGTPTEAAAIRNRVVPRFTSSALGDPAFLQLHRLAPPEIAAGGEDGTEMGALNRLGQPQRQTNLLRAVDEYMRLGLSAGLIYMN